MGHQEPRHVTLATCSIVGIVHMSIAIRFLLSLPGANAEAGLTVFVNGISAPLASRRARYEAWRAIMDLQPGGVIIWLIVGLVAGWLAGQFMKGSGYGLIGDIVLGIIGAFIGGVVFGFLMPGATVGLVGSIVVAFVGAVILIAVLRAVSTRRGFGWH